MNNNLPNWLERYINIFDNEQIHHAFIISGSMGIGKSLLIENLAEKILNNKISLENNPDFHNLKILAEKKLIGCLLYTSPSPRDVEESRMPSSA